MKLLIVEDYAPTAASLKSGLQSDGYDVDSADNGEDALLLATYNRYDVIILDVMLPKLDGWEVLTRLRENGNDAQVMMLTARDSVDDVVKGLDAGADDYLIKPFSMDELRARLRVCERKRYMKRSPIMHLTGGLEINTSRREVTRHGDPLKLTPKEYKLLHFLALRKNELVTRDELWENVYDSYTTSDSNVVDVYVSRLRKKLTPAGEEPLIKTLRGHGYILELKEETNV